MKTRPSFYDIFCARDPVGAALVLGLLIYYCLVPGIFGGKASGDGLLGFDYLPDLVFHHTLDLHPVAPEYTGILGRERTGHVANPCPIGPIPLWAPGYLAGLGIKAASLGLLKRGLLPPALRHAVIGAFPSRRVDMSTVFDHWMTGLAAFAWGAAGIGVLLRLLRRHAGPAAARFAVTGAVLATPVAWYLCIQPLYQHSVSFFAVTLFVERWDAWRGALTWRRAALLGALAGLSMLIRMQEAIWLLLPGLDLLGALVGALRQRRLREAGILIGKGLLVLACAAMVFLPQVLVWYWEYGTLRAPQAPGHMRWGSPALVESLFSTRAGLFPWVPALYLAVPGLLLGRRRLGGVAGPLALVAIVELWVNASAWDYHGSWAFGPRRYTDGAVVLAAGLAGVYVAASQAGPWLRRRGPRLLWLALALLIAWNGLLMELMRRRKTKSSSAGAYPSATWVRWAGGPEWLARAFTRWGYPFTQPAAWLYGWIYHMPAPRFEGIVGNYMLERDWRVRSYILTPGFAFADAPSYPVQGVPDAPPGGWPKGGLVPVQGSEVRLVLPLSAREPIRFTLSGDFAQQVEHVAVLWNGVPVPARALPGQVLVEVPEKLTHSRGWLNQLRFTNLPPSTRLSRLDFQSFTEWWLPRRP